METSFTKQGLQDLAVSTSIKPLTHLSVSSCLIGAREYELLGTSARFSQLRHLDLSFNCYDANYCLDPLLSLNLNHLEYLNLTGLPLHHTDFELLARSRCLGQLHTLKFDEHLLDASSAEILATSSTLPGVITSHYAS